MSALQNLPFNVREIREQFPALRQQVYGKNLIYFDNGATSQKPQMVLDAINHYYSKENANRTLQRLTDLNNFKLITNNFGAY